jgi:hypothetical protein
MGFELNNAKQQQMKNSNFFNGFIFCQIYEKGYNPNPY